MGTYLRWYVARSGHDFHYGQVYRTMPVLCKWQLSYEYNAKVLATLRLPRSFKAVTMQFTERR
jgi:hypothetical protein